MKLKKLLDIILKEEGVAETAGAYGFNITELQNFLKVEKRKIETFKNTNKIFLIITQIMKDLDY